MRITIATGPSFPVPALRGGAIARMWQGLAEEFARHGHDVRIVARSFADQPNEEVLHGVRYIRWGGFSQSRSIYIDLLRDLIYATRLVGRLPKSEILVTNDFWLPVLASMLHRRAGRVIVNANRFPKGQFRLYRRAARIAAASIAVQNAVADECPQLKARTRVFPNPVDLEVMRPNRRRSTNLSPTLLYVGRIHPEKGVHLLVDAFSRLSSKHPTWRVQLVGPIDVNMGGGGSEYQRQLYAAAANQKVDFYGPEFELSKLAKLYQSADLFCYPSLAEKGEAFGIAPLEAMACGIAPVVSDLECFRDYIIPENNGWVFNHQSTDQVGTLAATLDVAITDTTRRKEVAQRASETAKRFGYAAIAEQYLVDFAGLLNDKN
jgi:glycosyltransferase involved in cell wall biosynthesis